MKQHAGIGLEQLAFPVGKAGCVFTIEPERAAIRYEQVYCTFK